MTRRTFAARRAASELVFPAAWRNESCERFQRWADLGLERGTQAEVDRVEAQLVWFRNVRDEFAVKQKRVDEIGDAA